MPRQIKHVQRSTPLTSAEAERIDAIRSQIHEELPAIRERAKLLLQVQAERQAIAAELDALAVQNERLLAAATEDTLSGHLRHAIHASHRPLRSIATDAGIDIDALCRFLEGEHGLPSEILDRVANAAGVTVTLSASK
jgi:hypothetical protein